MESSEASTFQVVALSVIIHSVDIAEEKPMGTSDYADGLCQEDDSSHPETTSQDETVKWGVAEVMQADGLCEGRQS